MKIAIRTTLMLAMITTLGSLLAAPVMAQETQYDKNHPRVAEVNDRLKHQNERITAERKSGEITKTQAQSLRANDKAINAEKKAMKAQDGGHLTKTDQKALNQQLNQNSQAIGK